MAWGHGRCRATAWGCGQCRAQTKEGTQHGALPVLPVQGAEWAETHNPTKGVLGSEPVGHAKVT
jgi:hypothetical protein